MPRNHIAAGGLELRGARGIIWVNRCAGRLLEEPSLVLYREGESHAFHRLETDWAASFRDATIDFIDAVLEGRQPAQSPEDARETLAFAVAAQRSAHEAREVTLGEL